MTAIDDAAAVDLRAIVERLARDVGFDLVAIADAADFAGDRDAALSRIASGLMDGLPWFTPERVGRGSNPERLLPGAKSIICLGLNYYVDDAADDTAGDAVGYGKVARYARGRDYHRVMKRRMRRLTLLLSEQVGREFGARWYVDDGPMLDRAAAARSGLGWFGKNGNILTPQLGSWVLLGQIITDLPLAPDAPLAKTCGSCARCIPACPTDAIVAPYVVDNRRCISYQTIENKGTIPRPLRASIGNWVFGCDICQDVCPVNRKAVSSSDPNFGRKDVSDLDLIELLEMTEPEFRSRFAGTPVMRAKWVGMRRNACVALGNSGNPAAAPLLARALNDASPLVRAHAAWALGRIGGDDARKALRRAAGSETDAGVLAEIGMGLDEAGGHTGFGVAPSG